MRLALCVVAGLLFATAAVADPQATIETSMGTIVIALDAVHAPVTVANFQRYAREKHFNGTAFYRVEPGFVAQAGSWDGEGNFKGGVHAPIALEANNGLSNVRGAIAMARGNEPASADAEFFINLGNNTGLDHDPADSGNRTGYTVFGHVTAGMDVLDQMALVPRNSGKGPFPQSAPVTPIVIKKVTLADVPAAPPMPPVAPEAAPPAADVPPPAPADTPAPAPTN